MIATLLLLTACGLAFVALIAYIEYVLDGLLREKRR